MTKTVLLVSMSYIGCFMPGFLIMVVDPMPPCVDYPDLHIAGYVIFWKQFYKTFMATAD